MRKSPLVRFGTQLGRNASKVLVIAQFSTVVHLLIEFAQLFRLGHSILPRFGRRHLRVRRYTEKNVRGTAPPSKALSALPNSLILLLAFSSIPGTRALEGGVFDSGRAGG
jgi:hypothetical protein